MIVREGRRRRGETILVAANDEWVIRTLLVLLHRGADSPKLTDLYERGFPGEPFDVALRYRVVRVWEIPAATWLSGGSMLLLQGRDKFGEPTAKIVAQLDAVTDLSRLEELVIRLLHVNTWEELLSVNGTKRRPRGRK